jgi:hypothetical protein
MEHSGKIGTVTTTEITLMGITRTCSLTIQANGLILMEMDTETVL